MSAELATVVANSTYTLERSLGPFEAGQLGTIEDLFGITALYRGRATAELLLRGVADPLFVGQMQTVSAYLFGLPRVPPQQRVTSLGACLWDAVGAQYWAAAGQIAALSPMTHNRAREHEDDFLYVAFLMQRYFLAPGDDASPEQRHNHEQQQRERLARWEVVLDGALDPRLDLCHALLDADRAAFEESLVAVSDARNAKLEQRRAQERLRKEELAWLQPIWPEGLALLRFAERDGLVDPGLSVPRVPPVIRIDNPFVYHPGAWRSIEFRPARRVT